MRCDDGWLSENDSWLRGHDRRHASDDTKGVGLSKVGREGIGLEAVRKWDDLSDDQTRLLTYPVACTCPSEI